MTGEYVEQVNAWAAQLREGSTATWSEFRSAGGTRTASRRATVPTAPQLEVVRRLALHDPDLPDFGGLADLVLDTPGPGRGRLDVPLPWDEAPAFGSPPVSPEDLSADELLRPVAGALTRLLLQTPLRDRPHLGWRPFRRRFELVGAPSTATALRSALVARGLREGGSTRIVLAGPLDRVMTERWAARVRAGSTVRWRRLWRYVHARDTIPVDPAAIAERHRKAHVVVARDLAEAADHVGEILGVPLRLAEHGEVHGTDLLRVVNAPLALAAGAELRSRIVRDLWPGLVAGEPARTLGVPLEHLAWASDRAARQAERLAEGARRHRYSVHGDPALVLPDRGADVQRAVRRADTLTLGLMALGRAWRGRNG